MCIIHMKWMYRCTLNDAFKQSSEREESPEHLSFSPTTPTLLEYSMLLLQVAENQTIMDCLHFCTSF